MYRTKTTKKQKPKAMATSTKANKKPELKPYAHGGHEARVWHKTPTVLLIIKYGKSRVGVRGNTKSTSKEKVPLPFKVGYYVKINQFMMNICKMIASLEQRCLV